MNATSAPYRFHAFEVSYFSAKVRPALRAKGLWHTELRADIREIVRLTGLGFIPVVETPQGEVWQDSTDILARLEARHPQPPLSPRSPVQRMAAHLVELYVDEFATVPAMHYRWGSEEGEASARARFAAMMGDADLAKAAAHRMAAARLALGATPEAAPAIEAHTRELLDALSAHFASHPHLLGARPSTADCALMGPLHGHFMNDVVSRRLLLERAVPVVGWIERCLTPDPRAEGAWLPDDALAPTFLEVLGVMGRDAAPVVLECVRKIEDWLDRATPEERAKPPRQVGEVRAGLRGAPLVRRALPYALWMVGRTQDAYAALGVDERARVDAALAGTGWQALLHHPLRHRLEKRGFRLVAADAPASDGAEDAG